MKMTQYAVWNTDEEDEDSHYWELYNSLKDAAIEHPKEPIYTLRAKLLGRFEMKPVQVD